MGDMLGGRLFWICLSISDLGFVIETKPEMFLPSIVMSVGGILVYIMELNML